MSQAPLSTDLVSQLRHIGKGGEGYELSHSQFQVVAQAADEIERLQALHLERTRLTTQMIQERDDLNEMINSQWFNRVTYKQENERLRAALAKIVSEGDFTAPEGMKRIALEALQS